MQITLEFLSETPPTEIRLFKFGENDTVKGVFLFDKESAESVMETWREYGNDLMFDYEHKSLKPDAPAGSGKSAGWYQLAIKEDGLYAVNIKWTKRAAEEITAKEWRYYSPAFGYDPESMRIESITNVALTNIPATKNLPALVAADKVNMNEDNELAKKPADDAEEEMSEEECAADDDAPKDDDEDESKPNMKAAVDVQLMALTGAPSVSEALGIVQGLKLANEQYATLAKEVAELKARNRKANVKNMVELAIKAGKLAPAQREAFMKLGLRDSKELKGLLDTMPAKVVSVIAEPIQTSPHAQLSRAEFDVARRTGTVEAYANAKKNNQLLSLDAFEASEDY